jgi:ribosome recycling factor
MPEMLLMEAIEKMDKTIESYQRELNTVRTGRANPNLLDSIRIDYYGVLTPIKQISSISVPEASQLYIKPFDRSCLKAIEVAIATSELGLNPQGDGVGIRLMIPKMTEERRRELVKQVGKMQEAAKVAIRNVRRDLNEAIKKLDLPEDEEKGWLEDSQKYTDEYIAKIEKLTAEKEKDLMTI